MSIVAMIGELIHCWPYSEEVRRADELLKKPSRAA